MDLQHEETTVAAVVDHLLKIDIKFVAIDFDLTFINTKCEATSDLTKLSLHVRPFFLEFVPLALQSNLLVAIVTFSRHVDLIAALLRYVFDASIAERVAIRGNDGSWEYHGRGSREGKQQHMASAAEYLSKLSGVNVYRCHTVLIDDDMDNVVIALDNQVRAVLCDPRNPKKFVQDLLSTP